MKNGIGVAAFIGAHSRHPLAPAIAAEDTFRHSFGPGKIPLRVKLGPRAVSELGPFIP
jgi:cation transport ATPase